MNFLNLLQKIMGQPQPQEKLEEREDIRKSLPQQVIRGMDISELKSIWVDMHIKDVIKAYDVAFNNWQSARQSSLALVAFKGQGKSLALERLIADRDVLSVRCWPKITSEQDLNQMFAQLYPELKVDRLEVGRRIVVVDDCQNLFLRNVDGFTALNSFLRLMSKTWDRIFWVTAWERTSWLYLDQIMKLGKFFTSIVYLKPVESKEMRDMLISFGEDNAYDIQFADEYFPQLIKETRGLITAAGYWLLEGAFLSGQNEITLELPDFQVEGLTKLNEREIYALAGLLQNDCLTASQMALVINESEIISEQVLAKLNRLGLCLNQDRIYQLNAALLPQMLNFLEQQRFLYLPI
ncbi:hypothetical protein MFMK1_003286 [Metallumcola ferriviriculae]|uniref:ATP-binding protein n=1 Tax=Metallumcola ferriviriculae TaxID=3039180 RepID=A0AAU0UQN6_9FIRM|nr:hypothetical protein MFMK1_003286 [Desulfitibacteraceae bacterium MK1]